MIGVKGAFRVVLIAFIAATLIMAAWPAVLWSRNLKINSGPGLEATLDRDSATVGSIVQLSLKYHLPKGTTLPDRPEIKGLEGFTVLGSTKEKNIIRIRLLCDRLSSCKTGPVSISYIDKDGNPGVIKTGPVSLTIQSNFGEKPQDARLKPIIGIIPARPVWFKYLPWAAGIIALTALIIGLFFWKKKTQRQVFTVVPEDPAHIRAQKEIRQLESEGLFEKGDIKGFYFRFSEILRKYMESLRGFPAAELTTEEIALHIRMEDDRGMLSLLRQADMVKFADSMPEPAEKEDEIRSALSYIDKTNPFSETGTEAKNKSEAPA